MNELIYIKSNIYITKDEYYAAIILKNLLDIRNEKVLYLGNNIYNKLKKKNIKKYPCKKCLNCIKKDCGYCINCEDKPKFGGPGVRKKCCIYKNCLDFNFKLI